MSFDAESTENRDRLRAILGDTSDDPDTELLTDERIDAVLATDGFNGAVAFLAAQLAAEDAQRPGSVTLPNGLSVSWPKRVDAWLSIAARYRGLVTLSAAATTGRACNRAAW